MVASERFIVDHGILSPYKQIQSVPKVMQKFGLINIARPGSRTTRPKVKECIRSGDQEATLLTSFLIG